MKAESGGEVEVESRAINRATLAVFMARPTHSIYASLLSLSNKIFQKVFQIGRHTHTQTLPGMDYINLRENISLKHIICRSRSSAFRLIDF